MFIALATQFHRVELLDDPRNPIVAPKRLARDDQHRDAEDVIAFALRKRLGQRGRPFTCDEVPKRCVVETDFIDYRGERIEVLDIELASEKSREDDPRVFTKTALAYGKDSAG